MIESKAGVIERILELEKDMFLRVPAEGPCECKENLALFGAHRNAQFLAWSEGTLRSYLDDLESADRRGINLMTVKYARMDDRIPPFGSGAEIPLLLEAMLGWQREFLQAHAGIKGKARPLEEEDAAGEVRSFARYLGAELETYSPKTRASLLEDLREKARAGINMSEEIYGYLFRELGYESIGAAERSAEGQPLS
jgi:hypothetical protein